MIKRTCGSINFNLRIGIPCTSKILLAVLLLNVDLHETQSCLAKLFPSTCVKAAVSEREMKRRNEECDIGDKKKTMGNWTLGLADSIKNPALVVKTSGNIVVIKDKYPKAKHHFLIIPEDDIGSIFKLNASHVGLLEKFGELFEELKADHCERTLRAGFHAMPSMHRLHMHVISRDMVSPCLKTKAHWNSFTTSFFLPYQQILKELKENGSITRISKEEHKTLLATPLKCNQCDFKPKNMPILKDHLLTHV